MSSQGQDLDLDEAECILANLIYRKYIKGYMSHQHRVMVISKAVRGGVVECPAWGVIYIPAAGR
jgi:hypothetical protein